jgi:uncharacterized protein YegL
MPEGSHPVLPGGPIDRRDMHFFWLLDGSSSMAGEKIAALNYAVANAIPGMKDVAKSNPQARLLVRALRFADDVRWIIEEPTPIVELQWTADIEAKGETAMGQAISAVADKLDALDTRQRFFPPAIILVTDGHSTDRASVFENALQRLKAQKAGRVSQRFAIAIGADADKDLLRDFIGNNSVPVLEASDEKSLEEMIRVSSVAAIESSSKPLSEEPREKILAVAESDGEGRKWQRKW